MDDGERQLLRQIRTRLTVIAVATSTIAVVVALPFALSLLGALAGRGVRGGALLWIGLFAIVAFGALMIGLILRSSSPGTVERRGFDPVLPPPQERDQASPAGDA